MCTVGILTEEQMNLVAAQSNTFREVSASPFGTEDQIGMLNAITPETMRTVLANVSPEKVYDMGTELFTGMPSWTGAGDQGFQIWMTHTPRGTVVDDPMGIGHHENELVSYSGDAMSLYTHSGTHVDTLNHYGYHNKIWNNFDADDHLGRIWNVCGPEKHPPMVARGIMLDIAALGGVDMLPERYAIGEQDIRDALKRQKTELRYGDIVTIRTGRMQAWNDSAAFFDNPPGLNLEGSRFLAEAGAVTLGSDTASFEQFPAEEGEIWAPVHCYLLAEAGVPIIENLDLEELARDEVYEFAFIGAAMKIRGATAGLIRPIAVPLASH